MKEFLTGLVLPFGAVSLTIVGLTFVLFDVPATLPPSSSPIASATSHIPGVTGAPTVNDALAHALSALNRTRAADPGSSPTRTASLAVANAGAPTPLGSPPPDTSVLTAVSALGNAVKAIRDARTEEDIVRAEEQMRTAREQMEATCTGAGGPLCDSAREVRSLGY